MNDNDHKKLEKLTEEMMTILQNTDIEDEIYDPLKAAIQYLGFIVSLDNVEVKIRGINKFK